MRTILGLESRPHHHRAAAGPPQEIVVENSQYGLTWFRIRFGLLRVKAYTNGVSASAPDSGSGCGPHGFTVAEHAAAVRRLSGQAGYTIRQSAYDLPSCAARAWPSSPECDQLATKDR